MTNVICSVCGSKFIGYYNYRNQAFCWPCADGKKIIMQHFKARIAPKDIGMQPSDGRIHAVEMYLDASNIISAAATVEQLARTLGFGPNDVTSITEREHNA